MPERDRIRQLATGQSHYRKLLPIVQISATSWHVRASSAGGVAGMLTRETGMRLITNTAILCQNVTNLAHHFVSLNVKPFDRVTNELGPPLDRSLRVETGVCRCRDHPVERSLHAFGSDKKPAIRWATDAFMFDRRRERVGILDWLPRCEARSNANCPMVQSKSVWSEM